MANEFKLSYTASDINERLGRVDSLASKNELPTKLSDLINDSDFAAKNYVQNYAQPKGDYALKNEIPTDYLTEIPEEYITENELNSKGYLTEHQSLEGLATQEYTDNALTQKSQVQIIKWEEND
jgi:hypothetical protein